MKNTKKFGEIAPDTIFKWKGGTYKKGKTLHSINTKDDTKAIIFNHEEVQIIENHERITNE